MKKTTTFWIAGAGVVALILALNFAGTLHTGARKVECIGDGSGAPPFSLLDLDGNRVDSSAFKGKVILLDFWATWCPPCREEVPHLRELHEKYKKDGLVIIAISLDRSGPDVVKKFTEKHRVGYLNVMGDDAILEAYGKIPGMGPIQGIPTTFLIDRKGQICRMFSGYTEKKVFEEAIKQLL